MNSRRGMTLLEAIVAATLFAMISVFTMRALGQSRVLRGNARAQQEILMIAQQELERVRAIPAANLQAGSNSQSDPAWPDKVSSRVTIKPMDDGTWMIDVVVERAALEGMPPVRLTTIRRGASQP